MSLAQEPQQHQTTCQAAAGNPLSDLILENGFLLVQFYRETHALAMFQATYLPTCKEDFAAWARTM